MISLAHQEHPDLSLVQLCDLLDVSRSWYYESRDQADPRSARHRLTRRD